MTICVCDDNPIHLNTISRIIHDYILRSILENISYSIVTPEELNNCIRNHNFFYSVAILDIELGMINGIEAAQMINKIHPACKIIFITSFPKYQLQAYDTNHIYYIPKKLADIYLVKALDRIVKEYTDADTLQPFIFQIKGRLICLQYNEILYFEQHRSKNTIHTLSGTNYEITYKLSSIIEYTDTTFGFTQTHKSFIVNMHYITEFTRKGFILNNHSFIPISRSFYDKAKNDYLDYIKDAVFI